MADLNRKPRIDSITGLRGIACLFIVCYHYFCLYADDRGLGLSAMPFAPHSAFFFAYSKNAVELFFMISGFLTAYHYRDRFRETAPGTYITRNYTKLFIPSLAATLWAAANTAIWLKTVPGSEAYVTQPTLLRSVLSALMVNTGWFTSLQRTGLPLNSTMWFINVLLLCYLLYYAIGKLAKRPALYIGLNAAMVLLGWFCLTFTPGLPFLWSLNGRAYVTFFLGVLLCEFQSRAGESTKRTASIVWAVLMAGVLIARLVLGYDAVFGRLGPSAYVRYFEFFAAPGLLLAALNLAPVRRLLQLKPILWLGELSAAVYFVHNALMQDYAIVSDRLGGAIPFSSPVVFAAVLLSVLPAAMLFRLLNDKADGLAQALFNKIRQKKPTGERS